MRDTYTITEYNGHTHLSLNDMLPLKLFYNDWRLLY